MRTLLLRLIALIPSPVLEWAHRQRFVASTLAPRLRRLVHSGPDLVVTISDGPNRGRKMVTYPGVPLAYLLAGHWERPVEAVLHAHIRPGMTVADIGAHIGYFTIAMSSWVGEGGRVLSFEPNPATMQRLRQTRDLNRLGNVRLFEVALSDRAGEVPFMALENEGSPSSYIAPDAEPGGGGTVTVRALTLDDLLEEEKLPDPEFVKVDVEDHEVAVLRGARRLLTRARPHLLVEIHSLASLRGCVEYLRGLGYSLEPVTEDPRYRAVIDGTYVESGQDGRSFAGGHILALPPRG